MVVFCDKYSSAAGVYDWFDRYGRLYTSGKTWYDTLGGTLKAIVGYLILTVGSGGLTNNFRPVLVGLKDRFNMDAMVIDPYFGQNAVTVGVEEVFGKGFGDAMILLFIAFIVNILLVRFTKYTKMRALYYR